MEVKKGYLQTEIGIIPKDWTLAVIPKLISKKNGIKIGPFGSQLKKELLAPSGFKVYGQENVYVKNMDIGARFINGDHFDRLQSCELKSGDFIISMMGTIGKTMIVPKHIQKGIMDSHLLRLRLNEELIYPDLLQHFFTSNILIDQVAKLSVGGIMDGLSSKIIKNISIPLPPTKIEQTAIATALTDADALITSLEKLIEKKRNIKQGAMQLLLTPKKGWEVKKLGEIGECIIGLTYSPDNVKESGLLVLRSSNVQGNSLQYEDNVFVDIDVTEKLIVKENDILICVRNGSRDLIGKCALIKGRAVGETFGAFMSVFRSPYNKFIFNCFQSSIIKKQIDEYLGATINQITNKSLNSFEIPFPSPEEQSYISNALDDMDNEINTLEEKLSKYKMIKQGMMQELLTGKIRFV